MRVIFGTFGRLFPFGLLCKFVVFCLARGENFEVYHAVWERCKRAICRVHWLQWRWAQEKGLGRITMDKNLHRSRWGDGCHRNFASVFTCGFEWVSKCAFKCAFGEWVLLERPGSKAVELSGIPGCMGMKFCWSWENNACSCRIACWWIIYCLFRGCRYVNVIVLFGVSTWIVVIGTGLCHEHIGIDSKTVLVRSLGLFRVQPFHPGQRCLALW